MCGIAGFVVLHNGVSHVSPNALKVMSNLIEHRGPDGSGTWLKENNSVGLAHRRLSIIDLTEAAAQPMISPYGHVLSYNGEIYNYREHHDQLVNQGRRFNSTSDTETILGLY